MKPSSIFFGARFSRAMSVGMAALLLMGFAGAASAESWADYEATNNYNEAVYYMNKGYSEIGKVLNNLDEDKEKSAMRHFNYATKDFDKAIEHYAKAVLPPEANAAVAALKKGLNALEKSEKALEEDDLATAQNKYDEAQNYFAQASVLLD